MAAQLSEKSKSIGKLKRKKNSSFKEENKQSESKKKVKRSDISKQIPTDSEESSEDENILLNKEFKRRDSEKKKNESKVAKGQHTGSKNDSNSASVKKTISHGDHDMSDSEISTDGEIQKIANNMTTHGMEEMSDFSIQHSPKKKDTEKAVKKLFDSGRAKKTGHDISSDSNFDMDRSQSILKVYKSKTENSKSKSLIQEDNNTSNKKSGKRKSIAFEDGGIEQKLELRYKARKGFEPCTLQVSETHLSKEDLEDGKELWLIKTPIDFDVKELNGVDINLNGNVDLHTGQSCYYEVIGNQDSTELESYYAVLPSTEKSSFVVGPRFKGQIHVMQSLEIPPLPPIRKVQPVSHEIPEGLKQRFEPFGSGTPHVLHKKKHHHHAENLSDDDLSVAKKVKKEKKNKHKKK